MDFLMSLILNLLSLIFILPYSLIQLTGLFVLTLMFPKHSSRADLFVSYTTIRTTVFLISILPYSFLVSNEEISRKLTAFAHDNAGTMGIILLGDLILFPILILYYPRFQSPGVKRGLLAAAILLSIPAINSLYLQFFWAVSIR